MMLEIKKKNEKESRKLVQKSEFFSWLYSKNMRKKYVKRDRAIIF